MRCLFLAILFSAISLSAFAQELRAPGERRIVLSLEADDIDAAASASSQYQEREKDSKKELNSDVKQIKQEIERLRRELQGMDIEESQRQLEEQGDQLKELMMRNNEIATLEMMRKIFAACLSYRASQKLMNFPKRYKDLAGYLPKKLINATDAAHAAYGYYYQYKQINSDRFTLKAIAATKGKTGKRTFIIDETGVIIDADTEEPLSLEGQQ